MKNKAKEYDICKKMQIGDIFYVFNEEIPYIVTNKNGNIIGCYGDTLQYVCDLEHKIQYVYHRGSLVARRDVLNGILYQCKKVKVNK